MDICRHGVACHCFPKKPCAINKGTLIHSLLYLSLSNLSSISISYKAVHIAFLADDALPPGCFRPPVGKTADNLLDIRTKSV